MPIIELPYFHQPTDMYCQPTCYKIVTNYAIEEFKIKQKKFTIKKIAKTLGTTELWGTIPGNVELVNNLLSSSRPRTYFKQQISGRYTEITYEIDNNRPIIAWIDPRIIGNDEVWHVIVINGYEPDLRRIYFVDPLLSKEYWQKECESSSFMENRLGPKGTLIKLIIGSTGQQTLISTGDN